MQSDVFRFRFHWNWFPRVQLKTNQLWFSESFGADMYEWWSTFIDRIYASFAINELKSLFERIMFYKSICVWVNKPVVVVSKILDTYWISCWRRCRHNLATEAPAKYESDYTNIKDIWTQIYYHADVLYGDIDKLCYSILKTRRLVICGQTIDKHTTHVKDTCDINLTWYDRSQPFKIWNFDFMIVIPWYRILENCH